MKFGKLEDISQVDFTLPSEHTENEKVFEHLQKEDAHLYIGCTGWGTKEWKGSFYPQKTRAKDFLLEYGKQFNSIELNSTHYGTPTQDTLQKWYEQTPDDFVFCPKVHKAISHRKTLGVDSDIIENTINQLSIFNEKLGPLFMQLPPYFASDRLDLLVEFFEAFPAEINLSVELRHESWFRDEHVMNELQDICIEYNKGLLMTDVAGRRDVLHMRVCNDYVMIRFVGNANEIELHPSDYARIDDWVSKLNFYHENGIKKFYFFPHEPDNILAPELAVYLCEQIEEKTSIKFRGPKKIIQNPQLNLF